MVYILKKTINIILLVTLIFIRVLPIGVKTLDTTLVGTDKTQFIETKWTFTSADDYARGYVNFGAGIELMSTVQTYTVNIGIEGKLQDSITLNGNTLQLTNDLKLGNVVTINGPGWIDLNGNALRIGSKMEISSGLVHIVGLTNGGELRGKNSIITFSAPLLLGTTDSLLQLITLESLRFVINSSSDLITRSSAVYTFKDIEFIVGTGFDFELNGRFFSFEDAFMKFTGPGSTVLSKIFIFFFVQLGRSSFFEIGKGVTYVVDNPMGIAGSNTGFILDNSTLIADGVAFKFIFGDINFDVIGNCRLQSRNGGTVEFYGGDTITIFPGSRLEVDDNVCLKLGY